MGIVLKQSFKNTLIIYLAFAFGGINVLFLYPNFLKDEYYGLVIYVLSASNLLMPLTAFGIHYTIVKFFPTYESKKDKDAFLSWALFIPLLIALPIGFLGTLFYDLFAHLLSSKEEYTFYIYLVAIATAYFEVFYAWSRMQMKSVYGNILKELWIRIAVMLLLFAVFFDVFSKQEFILYLTIAYFIRTFLMMQNAFKLYLPKFSFSFPANFSEVLKYSGFMIIGGSAGAILLDVDKVMLPDKTVIELAAYYTVAVFVGTVIEAPGRAMFQILHPITSKAIHENNQTEIASLYKKSSINLLLICGLFFLLINASVFELFKMMPEKYSGGALVVLMISFAKLHTMALGNNGAIVANSKYYRIMLPYGIAMALSVVFLNDWLIDLIGMNGAALSTLIVIVVFNTIKLWYVKKKFSIAPFTKKTALLVLVIVLFFFGFYFWSFPFHPIINIVLKSSLILVLYVFVIKKLKISDEINQVLNKYIPF